MKKSILILLFLISIFCTRALAQTYSTNFPLTENPISEGGVWVNGYTTGVDWGDMQSISGHGVGPNSGAVGTPVSPQYSDSTAILTGTWGADQTVAETVYCNPSGINYPEVEVRLRSSISAYSNTGYEINWKCDKSGSAYTGIARWNGAIGNWTDLGGTCNGATCGVQTGDVIKGTITGTGDGNVVITAYIQDGGTGAFRQVAQITDLGLTAGPGVQVSHLNGNHYSSISTGNPGMGINYGCTSHCTSVGFSSFTATGSSPSPVNYSLAISKSGTGTGNVSSSPSGINCGSTCSATYTGGTVVTLTAAPDTSNSFAGWGGACAGTGICVVTMDAAKTVSATFTAPPPPTNYNLVIIKSGAGTGTVSSTPSGINCGSACSAAYTDGTVVTLVAIPDSGGSFTGWSGAGCSGTGSCVVTMSAANTVTATFAPPPPPVNYSLAISKSGTGTGNVSSSPSGINCGSTCSATYTGGTVVTLTAAPDTSNSFAGWSGGGCAGQGSCAVTMNAAMTVTATFTAPPPPSNHTLTILKSGAGTGYVTSSPSGIICGSTCSATYTSGTAVTLTATPDSGMTFVGWSGAGCSGTGSCILTMNAAITVTASFGVPATPNHWRLSILKSNGVSTIAGNGTVSSSPAGINCGTSCQADYTDGTGVTLTATPDPGSSFTGWSGGGCSGTGACVVNANSDTSVTASFTSRSSSSSSSSGDSGGGGGCSIATAAYGSYLDPHVYVLRNFRDRYLLTNSLGQAFVNSYYRFSPPLADFISRHETLKIAARWALTPIVGGVEHPYAAASILLMIPVGIILVLRRRKKRFH